MSFTGKVKNLNAKENFELFPYILLTYEIIWMKIGQVPIDNKMISIFLKHTVHLKFFK